MLPLVILLFLASFDNAAVAPFERSRIAEITVMDFLCPALNLNFSNGGDGAQLERPVNISESVLQCQYFNGDVCAYSRGDGSLQTKDNTCPDSIDPAHNVETEFDCEELDLQQSLLIGSSITATDRNLACAHGDGALCKYCKTHGTLVSGDGLCPPTVASYKVCPPSSNYRGGTGTGDMYSANSNLITANGNAAAGGSSRLADAETSDSNSAEKGGALSPTVIALLALNGVLVLAALVALGVRLWRRRSKGKPVLINPESRYDTVESVSVPLTHPTDERYYDAFDKRD